MFFGLKCTIFPRMVSLGSLISVRFSLALNSTTHYSFSMQGVGTNKSSRWSPNDHRSPEEVPPTFFLQSLSLTLSSCGGGYYSVGFINPSTQNFPDHMVFSRLRPHYHPPNKYIHLGFETSLCWRVPRNVQQC